MAKVTYYDLEKACSTTDFMGHDFNHNEPVEIDHSDPENAAFFAKVATNPFFKVEGLPDPKALAKLREEHVGEAKKSAIDNALKIEADRKAAIDKLRKERADAQAKAKSDAEHEVAEAKYKEEIAKAKANQPSVAELQAMPPPGHAAPARKL